MASTYVNDLRLNEMATGDQSGSWGTVTNTNLELISEAFSFGTEAITTNADTHTTTIADGATDPGRSMFLKYTGTLDSACTITIAPNTVSKLWFIENATSGSQSIIIKQGSGATITIATGQTKAIYSDGAGSGGKMVDAFATLSVVDLLVDDDLTVAGDLDVDGTTNLDVVDIDGAVNFAADVTLADGADLITASAGTSNFRAGVNAGNSIASGGNYNVVVGDEAGTAITTGDWNTALGYLALSTEDTGSRATALGTFSLQTQNAGDVNTYNTAVGYAAGYGVTTGTENTLIGGLAGDAITTGLRNTAVGANSLGSNTTGDDNVAVGVNALDTNTTGSDNTAIGKNALDDNTTGGSNVAVGLSALESNTSGEGNSALGYNAGKGATTADHSVFIGYEAGGNATLTGHDNVLVGMRSGQNITSGQYNVSMGRSALGTASTASSNTAIGGNAGEGLTTAGANVLLGYKAGAYIVNLTTGNNNTILGSYAYTTASDTGSAQIIGHNVAGAANYTTLGYANLDIRAANGSTTWSTVSDERYKKDIVDSTAGLAFVNALQPRTFKYKNLGELPETFNAYEADSTEVFKSSQTQHGFIAQEVKAAIDADDSIKDGFKLWDDRDDGSQEVAESALIPVLVKAIQELSAKNDALEARIATIEG
jgi:hypothetical protein